MTFTTNIAILGAGKIATKMATTVKMMEKDDRWSGRVKLYAVATRDSLERAQAFADDPPALRGQRGDLRPPGPAAGGPFGRAQAAEPPHDRRAV